MNWTCVSRLSLLLLVGLGAGAQNVSPETMHKTNLPGCNEHVLSMVLQLAHVLSMVRLLGNEIQGTLVSLGACVQGYLTPLEPWCLHQTI